MILWRNLKKKTGNIIVIIRKKRVDILIFSSLVVFVVTTLKINVYGGLYLLASILFALGVIIAKLGG